MSRLGLPSLIWVWMRPHIQEEASHEEATNRRFRRSRDASLGEFTTLDMGGLIERAFFILVTCWKMPDWRSGGNGISNADSAGAEASSGVCDTVGGGGSAVKGVGCGAAAR